MTKERVAIGRWVELNSGGPPCLIVDMSSLDPFVQVAWRNADGTTQEEWFHVMCMKEVQVE